MTINITNFLELRVCGLMRSGNHAIIEWIMQQHAGHAVCFLNNILHGDHDPYKNFRQIVIQNISETIEVEALRNLEKRLLIYSYEDRAELEIENADFFHSVFQPSFEAKRSHYLKESEHFFNIFIIRDPFNCLASRIKLIRTRGSLGGTSDLRLIVHDWEMLARVAIQLITHPRDNNIVISYNRWVTDIDYRKQLSVRLFGAFCDSSMDRMSTFGGGSSFLPSNSQNEPLVSTADLKVFDRWQLFKSDPDFLQAIADPTILELSEKIFGELPGTREMLANYNQ